MKLFWIVLVSLFIGTAVKYSYDTEWHEGMKAKTEFTARCTKMEGRTAHINTKGRFDHLVCVGLRMGNSVILIEEAPFEVK